MSAITWRTPKGEQSVIRGWERAWFGQLVSRVAGAFVPDHEQEALTARLTPSVRAMLSGTEPWRLADSVRLQLAHGFDGAVLVDHDGTELDSFSLQLNTALLVGNDAVCLAARIHGQCELHCYVEGGHRAWLADLIEQGRAAKLYRDGAGWEELVTLLRSDDSTPVVGEYSVTDSFPSRPESWESPIGFDDDPDSWTDAWYDVPVDERWALALADLRAHPGRGLELHPDNLRRPFDHERSLVDLFVASPASRPAPAL